MMYNVLHIDEVHHNYIHGLYIHSELIQCHLGVPAGEVRDQRLAVN